MSPIIIDACVAKASGGAGVVHPTAATTRDFLIAILGARRPVAYPTAISVEWKRHMSRFSRGWLVSMYARKLVDRTEPIRQTNIRARLDGLGCSPGDKALMKKDMHLLESCYATLGAVASLDDSARACFSRHYSDLALRSGLHWINPLEESADSFAWARNETSTSMTRLLSDYHRRSS
jgi:hypothetical protein